MSGQRHGLTVEAAALSISKELLAIFNFALVWGRSTKFNPQRVGLSHPLCDEVRGLHLLDPTTSLLVIYYCFYHFFVGRPLM